MPSLDPCSFPIPALCIDIDLLHRNLQTLLERVRVSGKSWRPDVAGHLIPEIAQRAKQAGARGVAVATLSQAEIFLRAGIDDVLITHPVVHPFEFERLSEFMSLGRVILACDHFVQAECLSDFCKTHGLRCPVVVSINLGGNGVGVRAGWDAVDLARGISSLPGVELVGVTGSDRHVAEGETPVRRQRRLDSAHSLLEEYRDRVLAQGLCCDIISAGESPVAGQEGWHSVLTEIQAGEELLGSHASDDRSPPLFPSAVRVLASVISRSRLDRAVLNVGRRILGEECLQARVERVIRGRPLLDLEISRVGDDDLTLTLGYDAQDLVIGDVVQLIPKSSTAPFRVNCPLFVFQGDHLLERWKIDRD